MEKRKGIPGRVKNLAKRYGSSLGLELGVVWIHYNMSRMQ